MRFNRTELAVLMRQSKRLSRLPVANTHQREGVTSGQASLCSIKNVVKEKIKVEEKE